MVDGDGQGGIFTTIAIRVSNEHGLPVVVEVCPGDSDIGRSVGNIAETIIVILVMIHVAGQIAMVDPNFGGFLNTNGITGVCKHLGDLDISDDNVGNPDDTETDAGQGNAWGGAIEGCVGADLDDNCSAQRCRQNDDLGRISGNS